MKKYLLGFFAIVLAVGFSAFTTQHQVSKASSRAAFVGELYWFDATGSYTGNFQTKENELTVACDDTGIDICERGYDDNDLVVPGHPEFGLSTSASPNDDIKVKQ
jgi:hypothetical protein